MRVMFCLTVLLTNIINVSWQMHRQRLCGPCTSVCHLRRGRLIVRASNRSSEDCGFDPRLGLSNNFSEV